jgi:hypothetical protein
VKPPRTPAPRTSRSTTGQREHAIGVSFARLESGKARYRIVLDADF